MNLIEQINALSYSRFLLMGLLLGGLYYLVAFDDGSSLKGQIAAVNSKIAELDQRRQEAEKTMERVNLFKKTLEESGENLRRLLAFVPENLTTTDLMGILTAEVQASGSNLIRIQGVRSTGTQAATEFYQELLVDLEIAGSFPQHMLFLSYLTRLDKILTVRRLSVAKRGNEMSGESPMTTMTLTIAGYRYLGEGSK